MLYLIRHGLWALLSLVFGLLLVIAGFYFYVESQLPDVESLKTIQLQVPLQIFTADGKLIQEYGEKKRIPLTYQQFPPVLIHAVLATEDQRFFEHPGVDVFGLARAAVRMVKTGTKSQGGSTITMQVARNFFLNRKKTFSRKFNEIMLAIKIDRCFSKEKILELYLNQIYLGNRAYGVGAAAQVYYGKSLNELTLAELAMLAGLPQAPSTHNPIANPRTAKKRRDHVLDRLLETHHISQQAHDIAIREPVTARFHTTKLETQAPYVAEMIRQSLYDHFGSDAYTKGYKVYTTIQSSLQTTANQTVENHLLAYDRRHGYRGSVKSIHDTASTSVTNLLSQLNQFPSVNGLEPAIVRSVSGRSASALIKSGETITIPWQGLSWARPALRKGWVGKAPQQANAIVAVGDLIYASHAATQHREDVGYQWELTQIPQAESALVSMNPNNGAILALVGGLNFEKSKFNRATQAGRQPGSSFKPFIYAAALNKGYTLATLVNDAPFVADDPSQPSTVWRPHNVNNKFAGPTRLKDALASSRNLVSIRILDDIGIQYAIDFVSHFGFAKNSLPHTLSLALGTLSVSPLDLTAAYAVFANGGYKIEPFLIDRITDTQGHIILQTKPVMVHPEQPMTHPVDPDLLAPRVISPEIAFLMNSALMDVIQHGTAHAATILNRTDIAGKTGTTNDQVDAWFAGYNPDLVTTAWIGFDTPHPLHEYAANLALPLWIDFMKVALQGKPIHKFTPPGNIVSVRINPRNGLLARANQPNAIVEYFRESEVPGPDESAAYSANNAKNWATTQESLF